jgi:glycerophosphoryl diester phosphodiesterase
MSKGYLTQRAAMATLPRVCRQVSGELESFRKKLKVVPELKSKLVLHRGWHSLTPGDVSRPLENTRQAYIDAARLGAAFAECDVWNTQDGRMVLCHDATLEGMLPGGHDTRLATTPLAELQWAEIENVILSDGSSPVLLETVLADLHGTGTRLVIELKSPGPATALASFLARSGWARSAVAWIMSFSFDALERFVASCEDVPRTLWLLDNPSVPYADSDKHNGETTFNLLEESFPQFLVRIGMTERFEMIGCGLYLQYRRGLVPSHIDTLRADIACEMPGCDKFIGLWTDASLDPDFDKATTIRDWLHAADALNTDLPRTFWEGCPLDTTPKSDLDINEAPLIDQTDLSPLVDCY